MISQSCQAGNSSSPPVSLPAINSALLEWFSSMIQRVGVIDLLFLKQVRCRMLLCIECCVPPGPLWG